MRKLKQLPSKWRTKVKIKSSGVILCSFCLWCRISKKWGNFLFEVELLSKNYLRHIISHRLAWRYGGDNVGGCMCTSFRHHHVFTLHNMQRETICSVMDLHVCEEKVSHRKYKRSSWLSVVHTTLTTFFFLNLVSFCYTVFMSSSYVCGLH